VVELQPHALEGGVLLVIAQTPAERLRLGFPFLSVTPTRTIASARSSPAP
jgi:hypothetical protein